MIPRSLLALVLLVLIVSGCSGGSGTSDAPGAGGAASPGVAAQAKDLVIGIGPDTTIVQGDRATVGMGTPNGGIYERLTRMDNDYNVQPWLAERWEFVEPNTWRFFLRRDVTFHDGTPLTAKDVVWTFERQARTPAGGTIRAAEGGTKAIDDYTVEFTARVPNKKVPMQLVHPQVGIIKADSDPIAAPIGTGPFRFVEYRPKEYFKVERYDGYWDPANAAKSKSITFRYLADNNARVLALRAGDVDIIEQVPREAVQSIKSDSNLRLITSPVGAWAVLHVTINGEGEWALTRDRRLREALFKGIDRDALVKQVWEGNAEVGRYMGPPGVFGPYAGRIKGGPPYDPEGARRILDELGWRAGGDGIRAKDGRRLEIVLVNGFPSAEIHKPIPEAVQSQLRRIGVDLKIAETTGYSDALKEGKGHLWIELGNQNNPEPAFRAGLFWSEAGGNTGSDYGKWFGIGGRVDDLINESRASADVARSQETAAEAMAIIIDQEFAVIPYADVYNLWGTSKAIEGLNAHPSRIATDFRTVIKR